MTETGSFTDTCLQNQIHDDASKSCSESQKEQEFVEDNHEETFHTSSFPYQIDTKASEICNKGQRELEVPDQNLHPSCIRLLKRQTVSSTDEIPVTCTQKGLMLSKLGMIRGPSGKIVLLQRVFQKRMNLEQITTLS